LSRLLTFEDVPKKSAENMSWRRWLWGKIAVSADARRVVLASCMADCLFWMASFAFVLEPRAATRSAPFVPWPHQEEEIRAILESVNKAEADEDWSVRYDLGMLKSRDMGVSWGAMLTADWLSRTKRDFQVLVIANIEDSVDQSDNPKSLFPRLDYVEERLPRLLQIRGAKHDASHGRSHMLIKYPHTKSLIMGVASGPNAGRGGRYSLVLRDEEAACLYGTEISEALDSTTRVQVRMSTPAGTDNSFAAAWQKQGFRWMTFHWSRHPMHARGLYSIAPDGSVVVIDKAWHAAHPGYKFRTNEPDFCDPGVSWKGLRSPWFDAKCDAADSPIIIARNQQMSFLHSESPYFKPERMNNLRARYVRPPTKTGCIKDFWPELRVQDLDPRRDSCKWWVQTLLDPATKELVPPQGTSYCIGVDIAAGTGASDSVISVGDDTSKCKVFEFRSNGITPTDLADLTAAVYRKFTTKKGVPYLAWDASGHGEPYAARLRNLGGFACYYHRNMAERNAPRAKRPGVYMNAQLKSELFASYRQALENEMFITCSAESYWQMEQFKYEKDGGIWHQKAKSRDQSPSAAGAQHGDIVTSEVILWAAMSTRPAPAPAEPPEPPVGSFAWREREHERARELAAQWS
jgi:hypothetical protein